jgi:uroporphyrinogen decarboxylase
LQAWVGWVAGGLEQLAYWAHDEPALIAEWRELMERQVVRQVEMILAERPDSLMLHGSGTITLQSPALARESSLPTVQKLTRMAHEAGVPTLLHSCGGGARLGAHVCRGDGAGLHQPARAAADG